MQHDEEISCVIYFDCFTSSGGSIIGGKRTPNNRAILKDTENAMERKRTLSGVTSRNSVDTRFNESDLFE